MSDFQNSQIELIIAEAIERVESGSMVDSVIASYPAEYRDELKDILSVVDAVQQIGVEQVPMPSAERRASAKQDFLAFAREVSAEDESESSVAAVIQERLGANVSADANGYTRETRQRTQTSVGPSGSASVRGASTSGRADTKIRVDSSGWFERLSEQLSGLFSLPTARLAPLAAALLLAILSISSFYTVAWSVPGDIAYPFKEWTRKVQLDVASPEERVEIVRQQDKARAEEIIAAQKQVDETSDATGDEPIDLNDTVRKDTITTIYNGQINGDLLDFGAIDVWPRYQPDANDSNNFANVEIADGKSLADLIPGVEVEVEFQIVPGSNESVQGVRLTISDAAVGLAVTAVPLIPTVTVAPASSNASTAAENASSPGAATPLADVCIPSAPGDWFEYVVQRADTLSNIASRVGLTAAELARNNCISDVNRIGFGQLIRVPVRPDSSVTLGTGESQPGTSNGEDSAPTAVPLEPATVAPTADTDLGPVDQGGTPIPEIVVPTSVSEPTVEDAPTDVPTEAATPTTAAGSGNAEDSGETQEGTSGGDGAESGNNGSDPEESPAGGEEGQPAEVTPLPTDGYPAPVVTTEAGTGSSTALTGTIVSSGTVEGAPPTVTISVTLTAPVQPTLSETTTVTVVPAPATAVITTTSNGDTSTSGDADATPTTVVITPTVEPAVITPIPTEPSASDSNDEAQSGGSDSNTPVPDADDDDSNTSSSEDAAAGNGTPSDSIDEQGSSVGDSPTEDGATPDSEGDSDTEAAPGDGPDDGPDDGLEGSSEATDEEATPDASGQEGQEGQDVPAEEEPTTGEIPDDANNESASDIGDGADASTSIITQPTEVTAGTAVEGAAVEGEAATVVEIDAAADSDSVDTAEEQGSDASSENTQASGESAEQGGSGVSVEPSVPPTLEPTAEVAPTDVLPTSAPPTTVPATEVPPTAVPATEASPTTAPATEASPTAAP